MISRPKRFYAPMPLMESPQGSWVRFDDMQALVSEVRKLRDELTAVLLERDALRRIVATIANDPNRGS